MSIEGPAVRVISLGRPLAGAVIRGPCGVLNFESIDFALPADGLLLAVHANSAWDPRQAEDARALWPECPMLDGEHPQGLIGVGLVQAVEWIQAPGSSLASDPWALGPWCLLFAGTLSFKPVPMVGYPGVRDLPDAMAARIRKAWQERPR